MSPPLNIFSCVSVVSKTASVSENCTSVRKKWFSLVVSERDSPLLQPRALRSWKAFETQKSIRYPAPPKFATRTFDQSCHSGGWVAFPASNHSKAPTRDRG